MYTLNEIELKLSNNLHIKCHALFIHCLFIYPWMDFFLVAFNYSE